MLILVVDDDPAMGNAIRAGLMGYGYEVVVAASGAEGLHKLRTLLEDDRRVDLLLSDLKMPGMNGLEVIRLARTMRADLQAILMTAYGSDELQSSLSDLKVGYLSKPFTPSELIGELEGFSRALPLWDGEASSITDGAPCLREA